MTDSDWDLALEVATAMHARDAAARAWGVRVIAAAPGGATVAVTVRPDMLNGHGTMHGGMIYCVAGAAFAYAINSRDEASVVQSASIQYLSPVHADEELTATATELARTGRSGSYQVLVTGADARIVATFHGLSRTIGGRVIERPA